MKCSQPQRPTVIRKSSARVLVPFLPPGFHTFPQLHGWSIVNVNIVYCQIYCQVNGSGHTYEYRKCIQNSAVLPWQDYSAVQSSPHRQSCHQKHVFCCFCRHAPRCQARQFQGFYEDQRAHSSLSHSRAKPGDNVLKSIPWKNFPLLISAWTHVRINGFPLLKPRDRSILNELPCSYALLFNHIICTSRQHLKRKAYM